MKLDRAARELLSALGRIGGKKGGPKGGKSRMESLTPEERSALGKKAAAARWSTKKKKHG